MQTQTVSNVAARKPLSSAKPIAKPEAANPVATVTLKSLLAEFGLPPDGKFARRHLRKAKLNWHAASDRWEFTQAQANEARAILRKLAAPKPRASSAVKAEAVAGTDAP